MKRFAFLALAGLLAVPSAFAIKGKTMYHYIAYDSVFWPKGVAATAAEYQKRALDNKTGIAFDTLVFAPMFAFGEVAGNLSSATYPKYQPGADSAWMSHWQNALPSFIKNGVDPIAETVKWCRANKREAVVALPVNLLGTHAMRPDPAKKRPQNGWRSFLYPSFKVQNPDAVIDPKAESGISCCVDYANPKVRDKFASIACEIASKYDIDGLMIDFTMEPVLFKTAIEGGTATGKEATLLTEMMTKIKAACKAASQRVGHPVAFAARVPDSVGFCKDIGIDLQAWFDTKMLDFVVLGGFFQLNRWDVTGSIAAKAGIPWYASFTHSEIIVGNDSGYYGDDERIPRNSAETCNARMADVILCKGAGCMYTMGMHWDHCFPVSLCVPYDAKANRKANKRYFVSYTNDRNASHYCKDALRHRSVQSLISNNPVDLSKGGAKYKIEVWDDFEALAREGIHPQVTLITEIVIPSGMTTTITFNGKEVKCFKKRAGTQLYRLDPKMVKKGANEVTVKSGGKNKRGATEKLGNIAVEVDFTKGEAKAK